MVFKIGTDRSQYRKEIKGIMEIEEGKGGPVGLVDKVNEDLVISALCTLMPVSIE